MQLKGHALDNKASRPPVKAAKGGLRKSTLDLADAELVRSSLLSKVTGEKTDYRLRVIYAAAMDGRISNASLRHLIFRQMASDWASGKCHVHRQEYFALIEGVTTRSIITAEGQLEETGYLSIKRRRRETSSVSIVSPDAISAMIRSVFDVQFSSHQEPEVAVDVKNSSYQGPLDVKEISPVDVKNFSPSKEKREKEDEEEDYRDACACENGSNFEVLKSENPHALISESQFEEWNRIGNAWGGGTGKQAARRDTDPILAGLVDAFAGEPADIVRQALADVLGNLAAMLLGPQTGVGFPAARKYAANHMRTAVAEARKSLAEQEAAVRIAAELAEIKIAKERAIADQGVAAHASAVATGAKIREARAAAPKEDWRDRKAKSRKMSNDVLASMMTTRTELGQAIELGADANVINILGKVLLRKKATYDQSVNALDYLVDLSETVSAIPDVDETLLKWAANSIHCYAVERPDTGAIKKGIEGKLSAMKRIADIKAAHADIMNRWKIEHAEPTQLTIRLWEMLGQKYGNETVDDKVIYKYFVSRIKDDYRFSIPSDGRSFEIVLDEIAKGTYKHIKALEDYHTDWKLEAFKAPPANNGRPASLAHLSFNK